MERGSIFLIEPVPGIERQEFDFGSFGQIGWLVDNESPGLHLSLQCHAITVAPVAPQGRRAKGLPADKPMRTFSSTNRRDERWSVMVSECGSLGAPESLPRYYPSPKTNESIQKSLR